MADLWGFEHLPTLPRKREFYEFLPEMTRAMGQIPASIGQMIADRRAAEQKLAMEQRQMALREQQAQDTRNYQQGMLEHYNERDEIADRKEQAKRALEEANERALPISNGLKQLGPDVHEPEIKPEVDLWNEAAEAARRGQQLNLAGGYGEIPQRNLAEPELTPPPKARALTPGALQAPMELPPPIRDIPVSPGEWMRSRSEEMAGRMRQADERRFGKDLAKIRSRPPPGMSFEEWQRREDYRAGNKAEDSAAKVGGGQAGIDSATLKTTKFGADIERNQEQERKRLKDLATERKTRAVGPPKAAPKAAPAPVSRFRTRDEIFLEAEKQGYPDAWITNQLKKLEAQGKK